MTSSMEAFKYKALEIINPNGDYKHGVYIMAVTKEHGLTVMRRHICPDMLEVLQDYLELKTAEAMAVAFIGVKACESVVGQHIMLAQGEASLVMHGVDTGGKYFAFRVEMTRPELGWQDITETMGADEDAKTLCEIYKNNNFDLFAIEDMPYKVKADVTII